MKKIMRITFNFFSIKFRKKSFDETFIKCSSLSCIFVSFYTNFIKFLTEIFIKIRKPRAFGFFLNFLLH